MRGRAVGLILLLLTASIAEASRKRPVAAPPPAPGETPILVTVYTTSGTYRLATFNPADGTSRTLFDKAPPGRIHHVSFAPDGRHFVASSDETQELVIVDAATLQVTPLVKLTIGAGTASAAWSPDGKYIAYDDDVAGESVPWGSPNADLFLIEVDPATGAAKGSPVNITKSLTLAEGKPGWSRSGDRLSSLVWVSGYNLELFLLTLSADRQRVTASQSLTSQFERSGYCCSSPLWTSSASMPDTIVYSSYVIGKEPKRKLRYVEVDARRYGTLLESANYTYFGWTLAPDGERLAVTSENNGPEEVSILTNLRAALTGAATPQLQPTQLKTGGEVRYIEGLAWSPAVP